jgi:transcriptional regulator with XRE-family HTH domain
MRNTRAAARVLKALRLKHGLTQFQVSESLGIRVQGYAVYESGGRPLTVKAKARFEAAITRASELKR